MAATVVPVAALGSETPPEAGHLSAQAPHPFPWLENSLPFRLGGGPRCCWLHFRREPSSQARGSGIRDHCGAQWFEQTLTTPSPALGQTQSFLCVLKTTG